MQGLSGCTNAGGKGGGGTGNRKPIPVLIVGPAGRGHQALANILKGDASWKVFSASTPERALASLRFESIPVVLFDREACPSDWRTAVQTLLSVSYPVCVLLVSPVVDYALWEEVVRQGGFDVLAKPLDGAKILRTLHFAIDHWHGGWIRRTLDHAA